MKLFCVFSAKRRIIRTFIPVKSINTDRENPRKQPYYDRKYIKNQMDRSGY